MSIQSTQEAVTQGSILVAGAVTLLTGQPFWASVMGAAMAVTFRVMAPAGPRSSWLDLVAVFVMSVVIGIFVGPYVASQLPDGTGVVGVGCLFVSFVGVHQFQRLNRLEIDLGFLGSGGLRGSTHRPKDQTPESQTSRRPRR